ncbi:AI-2E family transporter [Salipiger sp. IMCC34102]|uniref:AI-2E family transporter n=1 Tax=Salipiger sp. IMCC34102 TaxID=2510647 RepID=UPI00101CD5F4|nr:AI-2E family transporter [Salipiger sp. IMCC34102]RYH02788.1 AI-2E family transporter [Salipiger sp. IMCC34102]
MEEYAEHLQAIRRSLNVLCIIAVFVTCYFARDLILPVVLGLLIALTLSPFSRALGRIGVPRWISAVVLIAVTTIAIGGVTYFASGTVTDWTSRLPEMGRELEDKLSGIFNQLETVRRASDSVAEIAGAGAAEDPPGPAEPPQEVVVQQPTLLNDMMGAVSTLSATLLVALVLAVFLLSSGDLFYIKLVQSFETMSGKKRALTVVYDIERKVSNYLLTITCINAGLGVCVGLWLTLLGLPYGWIWGIGAFLMNFLPYLGAITGVALVAAISIITFDDLGYAVLAPIGYFVLTTIEGNFVTPATLGRSLKMNTVAVFLTVVLWAWLWGIPGALVAVPFLVVFKVIADHVDRLSIFGNFLGGSHTVDPENFNRARAKLEQDVPGS